MKFFVKTFPQLILLTMGGLIVFISFFSANRVFSQGEGLEMTNRRLYFQEKILPDHLLYPVLAGLDQLQLVTVEGKEELALRINFAWERLDYTVSLLERGYQALSFSTLTKAYKYYLVALGRAQTLNLTPDQTTVLINDVQTFQQSAQGLFDSFSNSEREELQRLSRELMSLTQFHIDSI
jgi:hypothetical protein